MSSTHQLPAPRQSRRNQRILATIVLTLVGSCSVLYLVVERNWNIGSTLTDTLALVVALIAFLALVSLFSNSSEQGLGTQKARSRRTRESTDIPDTGPLPYTAKPQVVTDAEYRFYRTLTQVVGENVRICPKVGLKDIFDVSTDAAKGNYHAYFNKISQRHVDFLLCSGDGLKPLLAVELDDSSHNRADRKERDRFVERLFRDAGVPLLRVPVRRHYDVSQLRTQIRQTTQPGAVGSKTADELLGDEAKWLPVCPTCHLTMVRKTISSGLHEGKKVYVCPNYKDCRQWVGTN